MPGDNPVYEAGNTTLSELNGGAPHTLTTTAVTTQLPPDQQEFEEIESSMEERRFDNPIYGDNDINETDDRDIDDVYTTPFDQQDQQSLPDHEFDNPIYGAETCVNN